jgi:drug/metabolite transporter (DMT)-like permease
MALGALLFATMNFLARLATTSASWASVAAVRAIVGALVALAVARARGVPLAPQDARAILWRSVLGTIAMLSTFYALSSRTVSLGNTVTLLNLAPVFLALLAPIFLHERTSGGVALAIALALGGVILVVRPAFLFGASGDVIAAGASGPSAEVTIAVAVGAALATSIAMMLLRRVGQTESPEAIAFHFSIFAAVVMSALSLLDLRLPSLRDAGCMVGAGLCAGVAQLAMTRAYALENAARVSGMSYLSVVASALFGATILGERPGPTAIAGMALVIAGGLLVTFTRGRPARNVPAALPSRP